MAQVSETEYWKEKINYFKSSKRFWTHLEYHYKVNDLDQYDADDLKKFSDYLGAVLTFTEGEIKAGKTKEGFLKNTTVPNSGEWKGDGISRPLAAAWDELMAK